MNTFNEMSIDELLAHIEDAKAVLEEKSVTRRAELMAELEKLGGAPNRNTGKGNRGTPKPKYRSKDDPTLTWAGRGMKPKWLVAEIEDSALELSEFLI